jgi:protein-L-isoaspartate(D-aspartate) O-methyltransferase
MSNSDLIGYLKNDGILTDPDVEAAMRKVDRSRFVPPKFSSRAYSDEPLPIPGGQTISAPHMVALMTQFLQPGPGQKILEVGAGSGYQAAVLAEMVGARGSVVTIERVPELVEFARKNLKGYPNVRVIEGDGSLGWPEAAPFDRILVAAGAARIPPRLFEQLAEGGRMVVPVGPQFAQELFLVEKKAGKMVQTDLFCPCVFVPLVEG